MRLLSPLAAALGTLLLARAAEDLFPGRRAGLLAAIALNGTLLVGVGAVTATPDSPLLLCWTAALAAAARVHATGHGAWWLAVGAAAGAAFACKYTAALLPPGLLLWLLWVPRLRPWLGRWQPWAGLGVAAAVIAPVLAWNAAHGWASFAKQGGRVGAAEYGRAPQFLGELLGGQIGFATPVLAVLLGAGLAAAARGAWRRDPARTLLAALTLPGAAVFLFQALGSRVQANWPAILYPAAVLAAAGLAPAWRRWLRPGAALGFALTGAVYLQAVAAPLPLARRQDPTMMRLAGWDGLAADVVRAAGREGAAFVAADNYGEAAILARELPRSLPVIGVEPRWNLFALLPPPAALAGQAGLLVRSARRQDAPDDARFAAIAPLGTFARTRHGIVAEEYRLFRVIWRDSPAPAALLPRPR